MRLLARMLTLALLLGALALAACGDEDEESDGEFAGLSIETCEEVEYGGEGDPEALIVSDLPMQGDSAERSEQQVEAIRLALEQREWRAGELAVGFQACDDSSAETGLWDEQICRTNAEAYAADERLLGVIGTYNSGCAAVEIPILSEAGVAMISPGNTAVCLTEASRTCEDFDPATLYGDRGRNYVRVVPNDAFQGAALAEFARDQGSRARSSSTRPTTRPAPARPRTSAAPPSSSGSSSPATRPGIPRRTATPSCSTGLGKAAPTAWCSRGSPSRTAPS
jgi:hypothetical protein